MCVVGSCHKCAVEDVGEVLHMHFCSLYVLSQLLRIGAVTTWNPQIVKKGKDEQN